MLRRTLAESNPPGNRQNPEESAVCNWMSIPGLQALSSSQKRPRCAAGLALRCWLKSRLLRSLSRPPKSSRNFAHSDLAGRTSADRKFNKRFLSSTLVLQIGGENRELGRKTASLQSRLRGTGDIAALQMKVSLVLDCDSDALGKDSETADVVLTCAEFRWILEEHYGGIIEGFPSKHLVRASEL